MGDKEIVLRAAELREVFAMCTEGASRTRAMLKSIDANRAKISKLLADYDDLRIRALEQLQEMGEA